MKKTERINAAKKIASQISKGEKGDPKIAKTLKAEGCKLLKDGDTFHFEDCDGKHYQFVPKGRLVLQYDRNDWLEYRALAEILAESKTKKAAREAASLLGNVRAKSLRSELIEQIESRGVEVEQPKVEKPKAAKKSKAKTAPKKSEPKAKKPKVEVLPKEDQPAEIKKLQKKLKGVKFETIGTWVWATGETREAKDELKRAGFHFSAKKEAWYWKPTEDAPRRRTKFASMDGVRNYWNQPKVA